MAILTGIGQRFGRWNPRGPRDPEEVEEAIADELAFHIDMRTQEYVDQGDTPEAARVRAVARFGNVETVRRKCRTIQMQERVMLHKIQWFVIAGLSVAVGWLGLETLHGRQQALALDARYRRDMDELETRLEEARRLAPAATPMSAVTASARRDAGDVGPQAEGLSRDVDHWRARLAEAPDDWRHGLSVVWELVELPPDEALALFTELWPTMSVAHKEQSLKPFIFNGGHVHSLAVLDLAARDETLSVQGRAFNYLEGIAFEDFSLDYEQYLAWSDRFAGQSTAEVMSACGSEFVARLSALPFDEAAGQLEQFGRADWAMARAAGIDLRAELRDAGGLDVMERCLAAGDSESAAAALAWARELQPEEGWMRENVLPLFDADASPQVLSRAASSFARPDCEWAVDPLLEVVERRGPVRQGGEVDRAVVEVCQALGEIGDARAIPSMIALIDSDGTYDTVYNVGYFGLNRLTGVTYDEAHDGVWWRNWWEKNQSRLPAEVQGMQIPDYGEN